jgi:hypothetical protein
MEVFLYEVKCADQDFNTQKSTAFSLFVFEVARGVVLRREVSERD